MKCPLCNVDLVMSERQGIEIDYCPQCRGVWLDRGELDKIIERSVGAGQNAATSQQVAAAQTAQQPAAGYAAGAAQSPAGYAPQQGYATPQQGYAPQPGAVPPQGHNQWMYDSKDKRRAHNQWMHDSKNKQYGYPQQGYQQGYRKKKRGGFLEDLFDFGD